MNRVAVDTPLRTLQEAVHGADVFLGLSAGGLMKPAMLLTMARDPLVFALANPVPEIDPEVAHNTRHDVIMATGRSDFPNQVSERDGPPTSLGWRSVCGGHGSLR